MALQAMLAWRAGPAPWLGDSDGWRAVTGKGCVVPARPRRAPLSGPALFRTRALLASTSANSRGVTAELAKPWAALQGLGRLATLEGRRALALEVCARVPALELAGYTR